MVGSSVGSVVGLDGSLPLAVVVALLVVLGPADGSVLAEVVVPAPVEPSSPDPVECAVPDSSVDGSSSQPAGIRSATATTESRTLRANQALQTMHGACGRWARDANGS